MSENLSELSARKGLEDNLFDRFGKLAQGNGTVSDERLAELADEFLIGEANVYGATTFYDFLKPENQGKKVYICNGTACLCAGTQEKLQAGLQQYFTASEIGHMTCLGRCYENSAFHYQGKNYSGSQAMQLDEVLQKKSGDDAAIYHVRALG
ncbi:MAG: formate dehydrogenase, partial [Saprospiraceae bacterium]|nr:formate dehydrogenase [Saprospiraceae bacterium]